MICEKKKSTTMIKFCSNSCPIKIKSGKTCDDDVSMSHNGAEQLLVGILRGTLTIITQMGPSQLKCMMWLTNSWGSIITLCFHRRINSFSGNEITMSHPGVDTPSLSNWENPRKSLDKSFCTNSSSFQFLVSIVWNEMVWFWWFLLQ